MARLFVAVWPPEEVIDELRSLRRKDQRGVRFVPPENWHVTLRFLGETAVGPVIEALDELAATDGVDPAVIRLGPGVDVLFDKMLVIPAGGADDLAAAVTTATRDLGEAPRKRFVGHLTLARLKPHLPMPAALGEFFSAEFPVTEVALVRSDLRPGGARYETVHSWPVPAAS